MTTFEFIENLKNADLSKVAFKKLFHIMQQNDIQIPYTTAVLKKGTPIERGRINDDCSFFNSEFEISYTTDTGNLKEFGRANKPFQSRFYGAIPSIDIKYPRIVLFSELVEQFRDIPEDDFEITMTIGRWIVKEDFEIADVCFSNDYFNVDNIKRRYDHWIGKTKHTKIGQKQYQELLIFFSNEFSKTQIENHFDYKLSCLYAEIAVYGNGLNGIGYPSVRTDYLANNVAITPNAAERFLELKEVGRFRFVVEKGEPKVYQTHYTDNLGPLNSKFEWEKVKIGD
jgi:phage antirepressor YoqD-like protein